MRRRLVVLALLGALSACDAPPREKEPAAPAAQDKVPVFPLSKTQVEKLSVQCREASGRQFRRDWKDGSVDTAGGRVTAEFATHFNARLNTCFYLLTVSRPAGHARDRMLFDINGGELYGEYLGPATSGSPAAGMPTACRVESMYCASEREWEVLVVPYLEN
jgi:hypothetical protein